MAETERSFPMPHMPDPAQSRGGSARAAQVGALVARVLRDRLVRGLNDPRVQGMVSILAVEVTPDLLNAKVRVSVMPADRARLTLSGLRSATRHLQAILRKETRLRRVPHLLFELDDSVQRESALLETIRLANANLAPAAPPAESPSSV
ncbi:MAG: 30S ribosome-binding factor RbfA [Phycisphaerales bacterium]